jgi:hypothetical protein
MTSDTPTSTNTTVTFTDVPNSFMSHVTVKTVNADGTISTMELEILKVFADQVKTGNYTIAQVIALLTRTNNGFHIP